MNDQACPENDRFNIWWSRTLTLRSTCPGVIFPRGHVGLATREKLSGTYVPRTKLTAKRTRPPALESHRASRRLGRQLPRLADIWALPGHRWGWANPTKYVGVPGNSAASYGRHVPIQDVAAAEIAVGDVVRLDEPQAQRVERAVHLDGRVVLELRPVGLEIWETVRVSLPEDRLVSRLGTSVGWAVAQIVKQSLRELLQGRSVTRAHREGARSIAP